MADDRLVGQRLGGFAVTEVLGRGGFATVYRARQVSLGRDVALKVLDPMLAREVDAARRFEREGWAAAGLDHPGIVPVFEAGEDGGFVYLAMRLVRGPSLAEELARSQPHPLPPERAVAVVRSVAEALDHAHERGLLHRDVKPANILLEGDRVWLSDFGIAVVAHEVGHYTRGAIGTAAYMAPEQTRPGAATASADLYSLACVAYECLRGAPPFAGRDIPALLYAHTHDPVPATGDPALDGFFQRALAKDPDDRFPSGAALADALEAAVRPTAEVVPEGPGPPPVNVVEPDRARPERRLRPAVLLLAAAVLAFALAFGIAALVIRSHGSGTPKAGSATTTTSTVPSVATTISRSAAGSSYLDAIASVNGSQRLLTTAIDGWGPNTTGAQAVADASGLDTALQAVVRRLGDLADAYPPAADALRADAVAANGVREDLATLSGLNTRISVQDWITQYNDDIDALKTASDGVRAALGLPPTGN